jgi:four helix bundle protein
MRPYSSMRPHFRFEDLEIWQLSKDLAVKFHMLAEQLDRRRLYRYSEQLRGAGLSLTNNIAKVREVLTFRNSNNS